MRGNFEEGYHGKAGASVAGNYLNGFFDSEPVVYPEGAFGYPSRNQAMLNVSDARIIRLSIEGHEFRLDQGSCTGISAGWICAAVCYTGSWSGNLQPGTGYCW